MTYTEKAEEYISGVLSGKIPACRAGVINAVKRQVNDLKRQRTKDFPYYFDPAAANRVCAFIELLKNIKGPKAGENLHLEPWQCFFITTVFGWKKTENDKRRFSFVYLEIPRGNGKSTLSSAVALYMLCADGELSADVYSFATTRDQARIVFDDAKAMAQQSKQDLADAYGLKILNNSLLIPGMNCKFLPKSSEDSTNEGLNSHFACMDELHAHKTRRLFDVVTKSMGKRAQSLFWTITTAGGSIDCICYEQHTLTLKILDGSVKDDHRFGLIYSIDPEDDWKKDAALIKSNPNWANLDHDVIFSERNSALVSPAAENDFMTKRLNVWVQAAFSWIPLKLWRKCLIRGLNINSFAGDECVYGLDLATKLDITAAVRVFWRPDENNVLHYYVFPEFWLPEDTVQASRNSQYQGWANTGYFHLSRGGVTDYIDIARFISEDVQNYQSLGVGYDPWNCTQLAQTLSNDGIEMYEVQQGPKTLSEPMKFVQQLIMQERIHYDGNPVLEWMMSNVVVKPDRNDNIYPRKERNENKIDGVFALITAFYIIMKRDIEHTWQDWQEDPEPVFI